ncbi:MAG TPA: 16S rRNA (cytosine(1402)-N(4))-methyltransferase RsmH [Candidatus Babeliaceae bacterium]|nr:16S rRNA (cytosine(1402)-N(4))-methyltransferase RsmH [Candidatus Babeliaceae bacterium]
MVDFYHKSVLVNEVIQYLNPKPYGIYIDATFGGGGHTRAILQKEPTCKVIAIDWDRTALDRHIEIFEQEFPGRVTFIWGNFAQLTRLLKKYSAFEKVDGILADFGTSQYQILHQPGFSFKVDAPLDMRMSRGHYTVTAADIINQASEQELTTIFKDYGEEKFARAIARAIIKQRSIHPFKMTSELVSVVETVTGKGRPGLIHPATKVFQALRIVVNRELDNIHAFLSQAGEILSNNGRIVCISFHSLEDRLVKHFFRENSNTFSLLTSKVVIAQQEEIKANPSSRSAKLRAAEKIAERV